MCASAAKKHAVRSSAEQRGYLAFFFYNRLNKPDASETNAARKLSFFS
jgi:hypothetical protein